MVKVTYRTITARTLLAPNFPEDDITTVTCHQCDARSDGHGSRTWSRIRNSFTSSCHEKPAPISSSASRRNASHPDPRVKVPSRTSLDLKCKKIISWRRQQNTYRRLFFAKERNRILQLRALHSTHTMPARVIHVAIPHHHHQLDSGTFHRRVLYYYRIY
jgi:hypothetical protein